MATNNTSFTQDMIDSLKGVAQKFGGIDNPNFQSVVNSKYGLGAFDTLKNSSTVNPTSLTGSIVPAPVKDAVGNVTGAVGNVTGVIGDVVGGAVGAARDFFNVTPSFGTTTVKPPVVQPADTDIPVFATDPSDIAWNKKQAEFDKANPAGTSMAEVKPVTPTTAPTPTTATTAPVAPVKPTEVVSPDSRTQEINANLAEGYKNDAGIQNAINTGDRDTFRQRYNYDTADQNKKNQLDAFFQSHQPTGNEDYYSMMKSGQKISNPASLRSPAYKSAVERINNENSFKSYSVSQFSAALKNGTLVPGTQVYKDLSQDPNIKLKLEQAKIYNDASGKGTDYVGVGTNSTSEILKTNVSTASMLADGQISPEEYKNALETPEITAQRKDLQDDKIKYDTLKAQYDNIETDVEKELKGKDVTSSYKNALIADRRKSMYKDLQIAGDTVNTKLGTLTDMTKTQAAVFETNIGLYKDQKAQDNARAMIDYQQAYANPDINSTNPQIATIAANKIVTSALDFAQTNGVPVTRNQAQIIADAKDYAQTNGVSFAQALQTTFTDPLHSKHEFANAMSAIQAKNAPATKTVTPDWKQDTSGKWYDANSGTRPDMQGTATGGPTKYAPGSTDFTGLSQKYPNVAAFKNNNPAGITWNANFENGTGTAKALADAGISYKKGTARPSAEGGNYVTFNSIEDGLAAQRIIMEKTYGGGTVGQMLSSWVGTSEGPAYAKQVASAAGLDVNSKISDLTKSQLDALQVSKIKKESPGLYKELVAAGLVDGTSINFSEEKTYGYEQGLSGELGPTAQSFAESIKSGQFTTSGTPTAPKTYDATITPLFDKVLAGTATEAERKEITLKGFNDKDILAYEAGKKTEVPTISENAIPLYRKYVEEKVMPSSEVLKSMGITADQFIQTAQSGYEKSLQQKAKEINMQNKSLDIEFVPNIYSEISATQREKLNDSVNKITEIDTRMNQLKEIFKKKGTEIMPTKDKALMQSLRQQIILKAKEVENLGVLNGPDLGILESIFPETNAIFSFNTNTMAKLDEIQNNYRSDAKSKAINYGARLKFKNETQTIQEKLNALRNK